MPEFLADGQPVATQDQFVDALTLGPSAGVREISFSVLGSNAVTVQAWRYTDPTKTKWILEQFDRVFAGQSIGVVVRNCAGLRFANATPGKSSLIVAELDYESDVELSGGSITSAAIDASGNINPPPAAAVNVQHNGTAIGTEPTLDLVDNATGQGIPWTVTDDSGNTRVLVGLAIVQQDLATGPPASPVNGMIWIATNVDANGRVWLFRYNASSASTFKWEFIGGSPLLFTAPTGNGWPASGANNVGAFYSGVARAGDYLCEATVSGQNTAGSSNTFEIGFNTVTTSMHAIAARLTIGAGLDYSLTGYDVLTGVAAGATIWTNGVALSSGSGAASPAELKVTPIRIA